MLFGRTSVNPKLSEPLSCIQHWMSGCFSRKEITSCNQACSGSNNMAAQFFKKIIPTKLQFFSAYFLLFVIVPFFKKCKKGLKMGLIRWVKINHS